MKHQVTADTTRHHPITITHNIHSGWYEARRDGQNAPVGIGDDAHEAAEHLIRAERRKG